MNIFKKIVKKIIYILKFTYPLLDFDFYHLRKNLKKKNFDIIKNKNKNIFLFEHFETLGIALIKSIILPIFARKLKSDLYCFNLGTNFFYYKLYKSFGLKKNISITLNKNQKQIAKEYFNKYFASRILTKKDIFNFEIENICIGIDIYESYLIRYHKPTLDLNDKQLFDLAQEAINIFIFWRDFLKKKNVTGIYINQRTYIENNILNRLAMKNKITVYSGGSFGLIQKFNKNIMTNSHTYKKLFDSLAVNEKKRGIQLAKSQIKKRFSGKVGVDMAYSTKSAYHTKIIPFNFSTKKKILICTHCFYDNPHPFGGSLFIDFYEWLLFLSRISQKTDYAWYIKPHPDYLPGTIETLNKIIKKFKNAHLLDPNMSFHQISKNIKYALTCHGTIAHELPLLGMYVINADKKNPHNAFNFSYTPKNLRDYRKLLLNLDLTKEKIFNIKDIYKFYYIHYFYFNKNNFFQELANNKYLKNSKSLVKYFIQKYIKNKNFNIDINNQICNFLNVNVNDNILKKK